MRISPRRAAWPDEERPAASAPGALPRTSPRPSPRQPSGRQLRKLSVSSVALEVGISRLGSRGGERHTGGKAICAQAIAVAALCALAGARRHRRRGHAGGSLRRPEPVPLPMQRVGTGTELPRPGRRPVLRRVRQAQPERDGPRHRRLPLQGAGPGGRGQPSSASTTRPTIGPARSSRASRPSCGTGTAATSSTRPRPWAACPCPTSASAACRWTRASSPASRCSSGPTSARARGGARLVNLGAAEPACAAKVDTPAEARRVYRQPPLY